MAPALHARAPSRWPSDRHTWVKTPDGVDISVREWGNPQGPEILFIHGYAQVNVEIAIRNEAGRDLPVGEIGEVCV